MPCEEDVEEECFSSHVIAKHDGTISPEIYNYDANDDLSI
jgi:hypothetical protein